MHLRGRGLQFRFGPSAINDLCPFANLHTVPLETVRTVKPNVITRARYIMLSLAHPTHAESETTGPVRHFPYRRAGTVRFRYQIERKVSRMASVNHGLPISLATARVTDGFTVSCLRVSCPARQYLIWRANRSSAFVANHFFTSASG